MDSDRKYWNSHSVNNAKATTLPKLPGLSPDVQAYNASPSFKMIGDGNHTQLIRGK